jgi:F-box-like/Leucine Rich repeat
MKYINATYFRSTTFFFFTHTHTHTHAHVQKMPDLNHNVLMLIFEFLLQKDLINVVLVSHDWNSLAIPILWKNPIFKQLDLSPYAHHLKTYGHFVHNLQFYNFDRSEVRSTWVVANTCNNVTSIYFWNVYFQTQEMVVLFEGLSGQLESLTMYNCGCIGETSTLVLSIAKLKRLKSLKLKDVNYLDDTACEVIGRYPLLENIDIGSTEITDVGLDFIARHLKYRLRSLNIASCTKITDNSIIAIAESCQSLTTLHLDGIKITDTALFTLVSAHCRKTISIFSLKFCKHVTDAGVQQVVTQFSNLQRLILCYCCLLTKNLFDGVTWNCTSLTELDLSFINIGSSELSCLSNLTSLRTLWLIQISVEISDTTLMSLAERPNLRNLHLTLCKFVDDNMAKKIAENCSFLNKLLLQGTNVSETCVEELMRLYPKMHIVL